MPMKAPFAILLLATLAIPFAPADARPGRWGDPRWDGQRLGGPSYRGSTRDDREGRVEAERFVGEGAAPLLGKGPVAVTAEPGEVSAAAFEAAVVDQLVKAGYDTATAAADSGQVTEIAITREELVPQEAKRKPVSGEMAVGVSNYGSSVGMGINIDLTKPRKALLNTRMTARVRDRASGRLLWEGRASIATRDGDERWNDQAIATKLAGALFEDFGRRDDGPGGGR